MKGHEHTSDTGIPAIDNLIALIRRNEAIDPNFYTARSAVRRTGPPVKPVELYRRATTLRTIAAPIIDVVLDKALPGYKTVRVINEAGQSFARAIRAGTMGGASYNHAESDGALDADLNVKRS